MNPDAPSSAHRYARHLSLPQFGAEGQSRLAAASVLVVGAGGLGTPAALYLATSGVGRLVISDFDTVDETNLPRQVLYRDEDKGRPKAEILGARLHEANPFVRIAAIPARLEDDRLADQVRAADVVLDCTDNFASRWQLNAACFAARKPLVSGAAIRFEGQVAVFDLRDGSGPCYRCLYSEDDESLDDCTGQGILAPVVGTIGCMVATETLKLLLGLESGLHSALWVYDGMTGQGKRLAIGARKDCPVCGDATVSARGSR